MWSAYNRRRRCTDTPLDVVIGLVLAAVLFVMAVVSVLGMYGRLPESWL